MDDMAHRQGARNQRAGTQTHTLPSGARCAAPGFENGLNLANAARGGSGDDDEDDSGSEEDAPVLKLSKPALEAFRTRGKFAGLKGTTVAAKGDDVDFDPPAEVSTAGPAAVDAWYSGFNDTFKLQPQPTAAGVLATAAKKRKSGQRDEPVTGRAGLDSQGAAAELSLCVHANVRSALFLPADDFKSAVSAWLLDKGYTFTDEEYNTWWSTTGHNGAVKRAITARASLVSKIKEAIWFSYSACLFCSPDAYAPLTAVPQSAVCPR
jgi:hypothetical protein